MSVLALLGRLPLLCCFGLVFNLVKLFPKASRSWVVCSVGNFTVGVNLIHTSSTLQGGVLIWSKIARLVRFTDSTSSLTLPVTRSMQSRNFNQLFGSVKETSSWFTTLSMASVRFTWFWLSVVTGGLSRINSVVWLTIATVSSCSSKGVFTESSASCIVRSVSAVSSSASEGGAGSCTIGWASGKTGSNPVDVWKQVELGLFCTTVCQICCLLETLI